MVKNSNTKHTTSGSNEEIQYKAAIIL